MSRPTPRHRFGVIFAAVVVAVVASACSSATDEGATGPAGAAGAGPAQTSLPTVLVQSADDSSVSMAGRVVVSGARTEVAAPLSARVRRVLVSPGDMVQAGAAVVEVIMPGVVDAAALHEGAIARRAVVVRRQAHLQALRAEGLARVADEIATDIDLAELEASISRARAVLRGADVGDDESAAILLRGSVTLRAPRAGVVHDVAAVVGAVVDPGFTLVSLVGRARDAAPGAVRVVVRSAGTIDDATLFGGSARAPVTATTATGAIISLVPMSVVDEVDPRDGARDRWFVVDSKDAVSVTDGVALTVHLPARGSARVPSSSVRLRGDGLAEVAVVDDGGVVHPLSVVVLGRVGGDVLLADLPGDHPPIVPGTRVARDARAALKDVVVEAGSL